MSDVKLGVEIGRYLSTVMGKLEDKGGREHEVGGEMRQRVWLDETTEALMGRTGAFVGRTGKWPHPTESMS